MLLYADDLKLYKKITCLNDAILLQEDVENFSKWCAINELELNVTKCKIISYTKRQNYVQFNYNINNSVLERVKTIKDLGIVFDSILSFNEHISHIVNSSFKILGYIVRTTKDFTNIKSIINLYCTLVRSKLESL